jgi:two-component system invasion response regulator UvrY
MGTEKFPKVPERGLRDGRGGTCRLRKGNRVARILVVDSHAVLRERLVRAVAQAVPGVLVEEAQDGQTALAMVRRQRYSLVLLDIFLPCREGLAVLQEIRSLHPGVPVLVLSMHPEEGYAVRALRAGASGYVNKESAFEELAGAVHTVLGGGRYVSPSLEGFAEGKRGNATGNM